MPIDSGEVANASVLEAVNNSGENKKKRLIAAGVVGLLGFTTLPLSAPSINNHRDEIADKTTTITSHVVNTGENIADATASVANKVAEPFQKEDLGEGVEVDQIFRGDLQNITNSMGEKKSPVFRSEPNESGHELTAEELRKRGFDPVTQKTNLRFREVPGGTYPSPLKAGFVEGGNGKPNVGLWGEIEIAGKPTGIFVPENFVEKFPPPTENPSENN